jgi:hypothetical protein
MPYKGTGPVCIYGEDHVGFVERLTVEFVSTHAPAWGATLLAGQVQLVNDVSIHAPAWGATPGDTIIFDDPSGFNPRSRVGSDVINIQTGLGGFFVSIHAPAWGATARGKVGPLMADVSIHAPAWGATPDHRRVPGHDGVSIHAPAWGATPPLDLTRGETGVSIHAPAWGATNTSPSSFPTRLFQSTLPRGERPRIIAEYQAMTGFQSTLPRGERLRHLTSPEARLAFQSTLPRGERQTPPPAPSRPACFNPRSRVGSDPGSSPSTRP